jgi:uncharacterized protein YecT (DUF1311 family)
MACIGSFSAGTAISRWSASAGGVQVIIDSPGNLLPAESQSAQAESPPKASAPAPASATDPAEVPVNDPRRRDPRWRLENEPLSMAEMAEQARLIEARAIAEMNTALARLRDLAKGTSRRAGLARNLLDKSQRCWQAYMEAQIAMEYPSPAGLRYGNIVTMTIPLRRADIIEARVKELKAVLGDDRQEGDVGGSQWPDLDR